MLNRPTFGGHITLRLASIHFILRREDSSDCGGLRSLRSLRTRREVVGGMESYMKKKGDDRNVIPCHLSI